MLKVLKDKRPWHDYTQELLKQSTEEPDVKDSHSNERNHSSNRDKKRQTPRGDTPNASTHSKTS